MFLVLKTERSYVVGEMERGWVFQSFVVRATEEYRNKEVRHQRMKTWKECLGAGYENERKSWERNCQSEFRRKETKITTIKKKLKQLLGGEQVTTDLRLERDY